MRILLGSAAVFLFVRIGAIAFFDSGDRVWGLDFARYILSWDVWLALLLPLLFCIPRVAEATAALLAKRRAFPQLKYYLLGFLLTLSLVFSAFQFRVEFPFLGDGSLCVGEIYRVRTIPDYQSGLLDKPSTFGTGQVLKALAFVDEELQNTSTPFRYLGLMCLVLFIPTMFAILRNEKGRIRALMVLVFIGSPALLFFFGYVELYAIQYVFLCLFFVAAYHALTSGRNVAIPLVLLLVSSFFGASSLLYAPAALFLLMHSRPAIQRHQTAFVLTLFAGIGIAAIVLPLIRDAAFLKPYILTLSNGDNIYENGTFIGSETYGIFSTAHLLDVLNIVLFLGGMLVCLMPGMLHASKRSGIWSTPLMQFGGIAAASGALVLLEGNAQFGLARDWDMAVQPALGLQFLAAAMLVSLDRTRIISLPRILPVLFVSALGTLYIWVSLNHSSASASRLESLIAMNEDSILPRWSLNGYENLRKYYRIEKNDSARFHILVKMAHTGWDVDQNLREAVSLAAKSPDPREATRRTEELIPVVISYCNQSFAENDYRFTQIETRSELLASLMLIMHAYKPALAQKTYTTVRDACPDWAMHGFFAAATDSDLSPEQKTAKMAEFVDTTTRNAHLLLHMGNQYHITGKPREAITCLHRSVEIDSTNNIAAYGLLAQIHLHDFDDIDSTVLQLERAISRCRLHPDRPKYERSLQEVQDYRHRRNSQTTPVE